MISREEIRKRLGQDSKDLIDYNGFNMSKTHSQDEENEEIGKHNEEIIDLFSDSLDSELIKKCFDCWKGTCYLTLDKKNYYNSPSLIEQFSGWTSEDIIYWLIKNAGNNIWKKIEENTVDEPNDVEEEVFRYISREARYNVLKRQKWRCNQCGCKLKYSKENKWEGEVAHIDHIHPFSKKESYKNGEENINELSNLQALCQDCNLKKGDKLTQ